MDCGPARSPFLFGKNHLLVGLEAFVYILWMRVRKISKAEVTEGYLSGGCSGCSFWRRLSNRCARVCPSVCRLIRSRCFYQKCKICWTENNPQAAAPKAIRDSDPSDHLLRLMEEVKRRINPWIQFVSDLRWTRSATRFAHPTQIMKSAKMKRRLMSFFFY